MSISTDSSKIYLGIDCGGTHLRLGLVDASGRILASTRVKSPLVSSSDKFGQIVFSEYNNLLTANPSADGPAFTLDAIGIGVPGPIDYSSGAILHSANLHNDTPIKFVDQLKKAFGQDVPVYFDRDAEVALIGEYWQGAARDCQNCLLLTLGTGIGGAIISQGRILTGATNNAGEIGHMYLSVTLSSPITKVPVCGLGHQGCFEAWLKSVQPADRPYVLGTGIASLVDIFNPSKIILGGGMVEYHEIDISETTQIVHDKAIQALTKELSIVPASLGDRAGVVGAAYLALKQGHI